MGRFFVRSQWEGDNFVVSFNKVYPREHELGHPVAYHENHAIYFGPFGSCNGWFFGGAGETAAEFDDFCEKLEAEVTQDQYRLAWDNCCHFIQWWEDGGHEHFSWDELKTHGGGQ